MSRTAAIVAAVALAASAAGCGSSAAVRQAGDTETPATSAASTPPAACRPGAMRVRVSPGGIAAGSRYANVVLTNTGRSPCRLRGPLRLHLAGPGGHALPTRVHAKAGDTLVLPAGSSAWSRLHWGIVTGHGDSTGGTGCQPAATHLRVRAHGWHHSATARWRLGPVCERGRILVTAPTPGHPG